MRFCEALDDLQTMQDFRVRRACWPQDDYLEAPDDKLVRHTPSVGGTATITSIWTPAQDDLFADDWEEFGVEAVEIAPREPADVLECSTLFRDPTSGSIPWPSSQSRRG